MAGDTSLVVDCPVCHRTIWANSTCHHGEVIAAPVVVDPEPDEPGGPAEPPRPAKGPRQRRDKGH